jgi:hypothetical protein
LIVSSTDEITRELLEAEATLLDSVVRETECEAVTEREDTYEVIIDSDGERRTGAYVIGEWCMKKATSKRKKIIYSCAPGGHLVTCAQIT